MGDVQITFTRHNQGRNWRRTNFNHECWLMLMGFPLDYWEMDYIQDAICSFGRLDNWVNNRRRLTRLLVRDRVADLQSIPQWIVYSDGVGNDLDSWTVQCEIVSHDFVGDVPPPEDPVAPFDFFGLGQPGAGPMIGAQQNNQQNNQHPQRGAGHILEDNRTISRIFSKTMSRTISSFSLGMVRCLEVSRTFSNYSLGRTLQTIIKSRIIKMWKKSTPMLSGIC